jgi:hypothetical protein
VLKKTGTIYSYFILILLYIMRPIGRGETAGGRETGSEKSE